MAFVRCMSSESTTPEEQTEAIYAELESPLGTHNSDIQFVRSMRESSTLSHTTEYGFGARFLDKSISVYKIVAFQCYVAACLDEGITHGVIRNVLSFQVVL